MPSTDLFKGNVCGICGNFDNKNDGLDMRKGYHTYSSDTYDECKGLAVADPPLAEVTYIYMLLTHTHTCTHMHTDPHYIV